MDRPAVIDGAWWDGARRRWGFGLWSPHATSARVLLFRRDDPSVPVLRRQMARDGEHFVAWVAGPDAAGAELYGFQVDGPWQPRQGHRFDLSKVLLDPYALEVWLPPDHDRRAALGQHASNAGRGPLAVLPSAPPGHGLSGQPVSGRTRRPSVPAHARVVYEAHVRGATMRSPLVPEAERGTYRGLRHLLPYLVDLGVTTLELLPVHQADPDEGSYWGYMPLAFGAVHRGYAATDDPAAELAELVEDAHARGLEVMVDVVLNHTTEEGQGGPTYSLRGVDNLSYYVVTPGGHYANDSGCGNIVRAGHPGVGRLLLWSLERLADLGIDGFRFDLAAVLGRDIDGHLADESELLEAMSEMAQRRGLHLVAEPWDLTTYQLGDAFPGRDWAQWNDRFRDDVRSFLRGEPGLVHALTYRIAGSPDIFDGEPHRSVNFVTAHDGFTLYDLVSYDHKHNEANGHGGTDGSDANLSWNCGWEGDEGAPAAVLQLRQRQMRNALALLLLSNGTPMLLGGDEMARTQLGNNNAYNQDNEISWFDWERGRAHDPLRRFVRLLTAFRRAHPSIGRATPWGDDVTWYGVAGPLDGGDHDRALAWCLRGGSIGDDDLYVMANAYWEPLRFHLQERGPWWRVIDTAAPSPNDILDDEEAHAVLTSVYEVAPRSVVVLLRHTPHPPPSV